MPVRNLKKQKYASLNAFIIFIKLLGSIETKHTIKEKSRLRQAELRSVMQFGEAVRQMCVQLQDDAKLNTQGAPSRPTYDRSRGQSIFPSDMSSVNTLRSCQITEKCDKGQQIQ